MVWLVYCTVCAGGIISYICWQTFVSVCQLFSNQSSGPPDGPHVCSVPLLCKLGKSKNLDHFGVLKAALRTTGVHAAYACHCASVMRIWKICLTYIVSFKLSFLCSFCEVVPGQEWRLAFQQGGSHYLEQMWYQQIADTRVKSYPNQL